ncbi:hypothetical protein GOBAR_DD19676 [Gossypium barbadense]|nr:hypothetical protein GOBAR_DD19676 [Gossypium barbadense]
MAAFPFPYTFSLTKPSISKSLTTRHHVKLLVLPTTWKSTSKTCSCSAQNTRCAPSNSPLWTVTDIAQAVGGRINHRIEPGQWFFAITGENVDAHDFITLDLSKSGCVGVIGNRVCENWEMGFVQVDGDTVSSLLKMAAFARNRFVGKVVAVTGSVGKTSTKAMIALALESLGSKVYHSYEHWNNTFGVSLSLITIPRDAGIAVLEMGMNRKGQLLELTRLGRPDIRVILKVATAHLENLVSLEGVAMAKGEMFQEAKPGDICVANADDPFVNSIPVPQGARRVLFGRSLESDVRLVAAERVGSGGGVGVQVVLQKNMEMVEFGDLRPFFGVAYGAGQMHVARQQQFATFYAVVPLSPKVGKIINLDTFPVSDEDRVFWFFLVKRVVSEAKMVLKVWIANLRQWQRFQLNLHGFRGANSLRTELRKVWAKQVPMSLSDKAAFVSRLKLREAIFNQHGPTVHSFPPQDFGLKI